MGFHVKWDDASGEHTGVVSGIEKGTSSFGHAAAQVKVREYDKFGKDMGVVAKLDPKKLAVLNSVATLHFDAHGHADGVVKEPNTHSATKGTHAQNIMLEDKHEQPQHMYHKLDLPVGTQLYPTPQPAYNKSPYNTKIPMNAAAIDKSSKAGLSTVIKNDPNKHYVILKDQNGHEYAVAKQHYGVVRTEDRDKALIAHEDKQSGGAKGWIGALKSDHTDLSHTGEHAPAHETHTAEPKPEKKVLGEQAKSTKNVMLKNSDHSLLKTPVEDLKKGDQLYPVSNSFGQNQYATTGGQDTHTASIDTHNDHGIGTVKDVKANGDVKVVNEKGGTYTLKPGTYVVKRDDAKDKAISGAHEGYADNVHPGKQWVNQLSGAKKAPSTEHVPTPTEPDKGNPNDLANLKAEEVSILPAGTKLIHKDGSYSIKQGGSGQGIWTTHKADGTPEDGSNAQLTDAQVSALRLTGKGNYTIEKPAPGAGAPAGKAEPADQHGIAYTLHGQHLTQVNDLKPGDKIYPLSNAPMIGYYKSPYALTTPGKDASGDKVNVAGKHVAGVGTVVGKGPVGLVQVKGENGKEYSVPKLGWAVRATPETDKALEDASKGKDTTLHFGDLKPEEPKAEYTPGNPEFAPKSFGTKSKDAHPYGADYATDHLSESDTQKFPIGTTVQSADKEDNLFGFNYTKVAPNKWYGNDTAHGDAPKYHSDDDIAQTDGHEQHIFLGDNPKNPAKEYTPAIIKEHNEKSAPVAPVEPHAPAEAPKEEPHAPEAHAPAEAPHEPAHGSEPVKENPYGDAPIVDKGKSIEDSKGNELKAGHIVTHNKGKGEGVVTKVLPSTKSAWVQYANGEHKVAGGHLLTVKDSAPSEHGSSEHPAMPEKIGAGEVHFDTATNKMHIGGKDGVPIKAGDKVEYTKGGETKTGTVKGIYKGEKTVSVKFDDGTTSTKKGSTLTKVSEDAKAEEPKAPEEHVEAPHAPEAPHSEEPKESGSHDGKLLKDVPDEAIKSAPVGSVFKAPNGGPVTKTEDGKWTTEMGHKFSDAEMIQSKEYGSGSKYVFSLPKAEEHAPAESHVEGPKPEAPKAEPVHEEPKAEAPQHKTPMADWEKALMDPEASTQEEKSSISDGAKLYGVSEKDLENAPVGTKIVRESDGAYLLKNEGGTWDLHNSEGGKEHFAPYENDLVHMISEGEPANKWHFESVTPSAPHEAPAEPVHEPIESFHGKTLDQLPAERVSELPIGTKLEKANGKNYEKIGENEWNYRDSSGKPIFSFNNSDGDMKNVVSQPSAASNYKVQIPQHEAPVAEPHAEDHAESVHGKKLSDLSPKDLENSPVGTKAEYENGTYMEKAANGKWDLYSLAGKVPDVQLSHEQMSDISKNQTEGGKYTVKLPDATPSAEPVSGHPADASPGHSGLPADGTPLEHVTHEQLDAMPAGSKLVLNEGEMDLVKGADGKWTSDGHNHSLTTPLEFDPHDVKNGPQKGKWHYESGPVTTPKAEESSAPAVKKLSDYEHGDIKGLPVGTEIKGPSGEKYQKTGPNSWEKWDNGTHQYSTDDHEIKLERANFGDYWSVHEPEASAESHSVDPKVADSLGKSLPEIKESGLKAEDFPVGTVFKHQDGDESLTKTGEDSWQGKSPADGSYVQWNADVNEYFLDNPGWKVDSVPGAEKAAEPAAPTEMKFKDYVGKTEDLPIGSTLAHPYGTVYYEKTGPNEWTQKNNDDHSIASDEPISSQALENGWKTSNAVNLTIPGGAPEHTPSAWSKQVPSEDVNKSDVPEMPIGTKVYTDGLDHHIEKTGPNLWIAKHNDGTPYPEAGPGLTDHTVSYVAGSTGNTFHIPQVAEAEPAATEPPGFGQSLKDLTPGNIAASPVGTKITYDGPGTKGVYSKEGPGKWSFTPDGAHHVTASNVPEKNFEHVLGSDAGSHYTVGEKAPEAGPAHLEKGVPASSLTDAKLDELPAGSTVKIENYSHNPKYWQKDENGNWNEFKKTPSKLMKGEQGTTPYQLLNGSHSQYGLKYSNGSVVISKPQNDTAFTMGTGEHGHVGDTVVHEGQKGEVTKTLSTAAKIKFEDGTAKNVKFSDLKGTGNYGTKFSESYGSVKDPLTASHEHFEGVKLAKEQTAKFAGASAAHYDEQGLTMPSEINPDTFSGLTAVKSGPVDTSSPLHGTPMPVAPTEPTAYPAFQPHDLAELPKWDSSEWLKAVEQRYLDNPNKAKSSVQESNNWGKIQNVMNGEKLPLQELLDSKYIDQKMFDDAVKGIDDQTKSNEAIKAANDAKTVAQKHEYDAAKAEHIASYQKKLDEYNSAKAAWMAANPSPNAVKIADIPPTSQENFTGGPADWSKAHIGTHTAQTVIDSISKDDVLAKHGLSFAVDSDQIENLDVKVTRIIDKSGEQKLEFKFKVTAPYGKILEDKLKGQGGVQQIDGIYPTKMAKDPSTGLLKEDGKPSSEFINDGTRYAYLDETTGGKVLLQRAMYTDGLNVSNNNNSVKIHMPVGSSAEDFQKTLENMGIVNARPSTEGDIRVLAENRLLSLAGETVGTVKAHDANINLSGTDREAQLAKIAKDYGVTPDDMTFKVEPNGRVKFFLSDEKAQALADRWNVRSFKHNLSGGGNLDMWKEMLTGATPGMTSTYHRFNEGIGGHGMSSSTDMGNGAGDYNYLTPYSEYKMAGSHTVVLKPSAVFKRTDFWANSMDNYGKKDSGSSTPWRKFDQNNYSGSAGYDKGGMYEVLPQDTVPLSDWAFAVVDHSTRADILKMLEDKGVSEINGIPVGNFILSDGMTPPQY